MAKYLDQAGLQLVLSKLTNKYDQRFLGIHATADEAQKVVHKLTINVGDEEQRLFDGSADHEITVAAKVHGHQANEVAYSNAGISGAADVKGALDIIVKNIQIANGVISNATANMNSLQDALTQEINDRAEAVRLEKEAREEADTGLDTRIKALEKLLEGSGNVDEAIQAVIDRLDIEEKRSAAKDKEHDDAIADHKARLEVIEGEIGVAGSIKDAVNEEKLRAEGKEAELNTAIGNEKDRAMAAEQDLADDLADEADARAEADGVLQGKIDVEKGRIDVLNGDENTAGSVKKAVADAEARVKVVTDRIDGEMDAVEARLDIIEGTGEGSIKKAVADLVDGAPETLDTLNELAAALKDNPDIITELENQYKAAVKAEEEARIAKDTEHENRMKDIEDDLAQEVQDRKDAVSTEAGLREAADNELSGRLDVIEGIIEGDEGTTLKDIIEDIKENAEAIKTEATERKAADEAIQDQIDVINGAADVEGSFRKAIADQAATQDAIDKAQDQRVKNLEDKVGNDGGSADASTGLVATLRGAIESEAATREAEDGKLSKRLTDVENLIGGGDGSATLANLNERLKDVEAEQLVQNKNISDNAAAIAAIVALEESDIDAAFNAVFQ